jgi:GNAT superfamily N-acetyltransferase
MAPDAFPFADLALARRLEGTEGAAGRSFVEARARVQPGVGACWVEAGGASAMFDGVGSPMTQTFGLGLAEPATAELLDRLERFFDDRKAPTYHETSPIADPGLLPLLATRGYQPFEYTSVLYQPLGASSGEPPPNRGSIAVTRVGGGDDRGWSQTVVAGWQAAGDLASFLAGIGGVQAAAAGYTRFLASDGGRPVGAGVLFVKDGVALLAGACTIPEARRRGAQRALLEARLRHARESGCELAMMCALPGSGSQRNAERNGFRIAYTRVKWQRTR